VQAADDAPSEGLLRGEWHRTFLFLNMFSRYALPLLDERAVNLAFEELSRKVHGSDASECTDKLRKFFRKFCIPGRSARGVILYGPPGTGKTLNASTVVETCGLHMVSNVLGGSDMNASLEGQTEGNARGLLDRGKETPWFPCALFIDEIDALVLNREQNESEWGCSELGLASHCVFG
jgi:ATP-dependent Zn protease